MRKREYPHRGPAARQETEESFGGGLILPQRPRNMAATKNEPRGNTDRPIRQSSWGKNGKSYFIVGLAVGVDCDGGTY
jgi:hypothetical protein